MGSCCGSQDDRHNQNWMERGSAGTCSLIDVEPDFLVWNRWEGLCSARDRSWLRFSARLLFYQLLLWWEIASWWILVTAVKSLFYLLARVMMASILSLTQLLKWRTYSRFVASHLRISYQVQLSQQNLSSRCRVLFGKWNAACHKQSTWYDCFSFYDCLAVLRIGIRIGIEFVWRFKNQSQKFV